MFNNEAENLNTTTKRTADQMLDSQQGSSKKMATNMLTISQQEMEAIQARLAKVEELLKLNSNLEEENKVVKQALRESNKCLAEEKQFRLVKNGARPKATQQQAQVPLSNSFAAIADEEMPAQQAAIPKTKRGDIPPIYAKMECKVLNDRLFAAGFQKGDYLMVRRGAQVTINPKTAEVRDRILAELNKVDERVQYHTYTKESERPMKAILKGLGQYAANEVFEELLAEESLPVKPTGLKKLTTAYTRRNEVDSGLFVASFPPGTKMNDVKPLAGLYNVKAWFEPVRKATGPIQCYNCQEVGHAAINCRNDPRCVKCSHGHESRKCPVVTKETPRTEMHCCLCKKSGHPASWSKCEKLIELQQRWLDAKERQANFDRQKTFKHAKKQNNNQRGPEVVRDEQPLRGEWRAPPREYLFGRGETRREQDEEEIRRLREDNRQMKEEMSRMRETIDRMYNLMDRVLGPNVQTRYD